MIAEKRKLFFSFLQLLANVMQGVVCGVSAGSTISCCCVNVVQTHIHCVRQIRDVLPFHCILSPTIQNIQPHDAHQHAPPARTTNTHHLHSCIGKCEGMWGSAVLRAARTQLQCFPVSGMCLVARERPN